MYSSRLGATSGQNRQSILIHVIKCQRGTRLYPSLTIAPSSCQSRLYLQYVCLYVQYVWPLGCKVRRFTLHWTSSLVTSLVLFNWHLTKQAVGRPAVWPVSEKRALLIKANNCSCSFQDLLHSVNISRLCSPAIPSPSYCKQTHHAKGILSLFINKKHRWLV